MRRSGWQRRRGREVEPSSFTAGQTLYRLEQRDDGSYTFLTFRYERETKHRIRVTPMRHNGELMADRTVLKGSVEASLLFASQAEAVRHKLASLERAAIRHEQTARRRREDMQDLQAFGEREGITCFDS